MEANKYTVTKNQIMELLAWISSGQIAIPEIQRPFVWKKTQVRDLIDSLYNDYPVGYIITWLSSDVRIKDGNSSLGRQILIDGQQRVTALRAAISGLPVINDRYKEENIAIAFNPVTEKFKVQDSAVKKAAEWIPDISVVMQNGFSTRKFLKEYAKNNKIEDEDEIDEIEKRLTKLMGIKNKEIGNIVLSSSLPIDVVNEIFIRVNQKGTKLSNADFVMSKIAVYEKEPGDEYGVKLRKLLDYFCALSVEPMKHKDIEANDKTFAESDDYARIKWLKGVQDDLFDPEYSDVLQTVLALQFDRNKLGELVALLSGRDFEKKEDLPEVADESFRLLREGIEKYTKEYSFNHFIQNILMASGYSDKSILIAKAPVNYIYGIYLRLIDINDINSESLSSMRRLFVLSLLKSRLTGTQLPFTEDFKRIKKPGDLKEMVKKMEMQELTDIYWESTLPDEFDKTNTSNQFWSVFVAAQRKLNCHGFLTKNLKVAEMTTPNIHHIFPKSYLISQGVDKDGYNKIANFVYLRDDINKKVDDVAPKDYMKKVLEFNGSYNAEIENKKDLSDNLEENAIPEEIVDYDIKNYETFLKKRRENMAKLVKKYYYSL